tara:strand:+ start:854 stop:3022 length:2169 start_codon:yes stop_codon:yes gene_type:complete
MAIERVIKIKVTSKDADTKVKKLDKSFVGLGKAAKLAGLSIAALTALIVKQADKYTQLRTKLKLVTKSKEELADVEKKLIKLSIDTNTDLEASVNLYSRLARATKEAGTSQEDLLKITKSINQAFVVSGATGSEASSAITQLSQALASGVLRGDEFNSVAENGSRLAEALATSLGKTQGQLRKLAGEGKLTTGIITRALIEQSETIEKEFAKVEPTVAAAFTNLGTTLLSSAGKINDAVKSVAGDSLVEIVANSIKAIEQLFIDFNRFLDTVENKELQEGFQETQEGILETQGKINKVIEQTKSLNIENSKIGEIALQNNVKVLANLNMELALLKLKEQSLGKQLGLENLLAGAGTDGTQSGDTSGKAKVIPKKKSKTSTVSAADLLAQQEIIKTAELTKSQQKNLDKEQEAIKKRLDLIKEGNDQELVTLKKFFDDQESIRLGAKTQEQVDLENSRMSEIEKSNSSFAQRLELQKRNLEIEFAEKQAIKEQQFLLQLTKEDDEVAFTKEREEERKQEKKELENESWLADIENKQERQEQEFAIDEEFADRKAQLEKSAAQAKLLENLSSGEQLFGVLAKNSKKALKLQQAFTLAQAGVSIATGIARAQELGFPANIAEAARVAATGIKVVQSIKSASKGKASIPSVSGGSAASSSTPDSLSGRQDLVQRNIATENTELNLVRREIANLDSESVPTETVRRLLGAIDDNLESGTASSNSIGG